MRPTCQLIAALLLALSADRARGMDDITLAPLRQAVIRGTEDGRITTTYVAFGGATVRARLTGADDQTLHVVVAGAQVPLGWDKVELRYLAGMAAKVAETSDEWWALGEVYAELEMTDESESALHKAAQLDECYREMLAERRTVAEAKRKAKPEAQQSAPSTTVARKRSRGPDRRETPRSFPPWKGKTPERGVRTDRPRLFVTPDRFAFLRRSGATGRSYGAMKGYCRGNTGNPYFAPMQALVYLIEGDESYGRTAIDNMLRTIASARARGESNFTFGTMAAAAMIYDWCHPLLSDDEKARFTTWLLREYDEQSKAYRGEHYHNFNTAAAHAFGLAGYALHGDEPRAAELIANGVRERFEKGILGACAKGNAGGAWAEGEGYGYTTAPDVIQLAEVIRTCEGIDYFDDPRGHAFFYGRLAYMMFATYPGARGDARMTFYVRGDGMRGGNTLDARGNLISLVYAYAGTRLASLAEDFVAKGGYAVSPYRDGMWMDVLWGRPGLARLPVDGFRLSHHAAGQGVVHMRSDWSADAALVSFICGDHYCYHQHPDAGSFSIVRFGEELAVDSGEYDGNGTPHMGNYQSRTIAHNSIVLAGYEGKTVSWHRVGPADDGGQPIGKVERFIETGDILAYDTQQEYTYVAGDLTASYRGRLKGWVRHVLFIRPETIVVFDVIRSSPQHYPRWLLHTWNEPATGEGVFRAEKGAGALLGTVLLPQKHAMKKLEGFNVAGEQYPPTGAKFGDTARWRLEITPEAPTETTAFLVVMQASASSAKRAPPAALRKDGGIGCQIGNRVRVRFKSNGAPGGELTLGGQTVQLGERVSPDAAP